MGLLRKDKRHPADLLAGTQVQLQDSKQPQSCNWGYAILSLAIKIKITLDSKM